MSFVQLSVQSFPVSTTLLTSEARPSPEIRSVALSLNIIYGFLPHVFDFLIQPRLAQSSLVYTADLERCFASAWRSRIPPLQGSRRPSLCMSTSQLTWPSPYVSIQASELIRLRILTLDRQSTSPIWHKCSVLLGLDCLRNRFRLCSARPTKVHGWLNRSLL